MKKKSLLIWIIIIAPFIIFSQKQTSIQSLPAQKSLALLDNNKPEINAEYEKVLKEYETLLKKYPDKKELFFNLGNLNYLSGDLESAIQNYNQALFNENPEKKHILFIIWEMFFMSRGILKKV